MQSPIFLATIVLVTVAGLLVFLTIYFSLYIYKIKESIEYVESAEPCAIKKAYGAWGEPCKEYLLNSINDLNNRIEVLENAK